jgi:hypothetical protein
MQILLQSTPNSWVPFQRFKISQHSTISTFARLPSRSTYQDIIFNEIASDEIQLVWFGKFNFNNLTNFLDDFQLFDEKNCLHPWLSRWRVRRVLIHMRRAKNGTETDLVWDTEMLRNYTSTRREYATILRSRVQTPLLIDAETFWLGRKGMKLFFRQEKETRWPEMFTRFDILTAGRKVCQLLDMF